VATSAIELSRFRLPARTGSKLGQHAGSAAHFELVERIAELPHVQIVEQIGSHGQITACVNLQTDQRPARRQSPPAFYCAVSPTGIIVDGLSESEQLEVVDQDWGTREGHRIQLSLPRDDAELEVCWSILHRAYTSIINAPERLRKRRKCSFDRLPKPSRTTLTR
jgi:hypothetical protein